MSVNISKHPILCINEELTELTYILPRHIKTFCKVQGCKGDSLKIQFQQLKLKPINSLYRPSTYTYLNIEKEGVQERRQLNVHNEDHKNHNSIDYDCENERIAGEAVQA